MYTKICKFLRRNFKWIIGVVFVGYITLCISEYDQLTVTKKQAKQALTNLRFQDDHMYVLCKRLQNTTRGSSEYNSLLEKIALTSQNISSPLIETISNVRELYEKKAITDKSYKIIATFTHQNDALFNADKNVCPLLNSLTPDALKQIQDQIDKMLDQDFREFFRWVFLRIIGIY